MRGYAVGSGGGINESLLVSEEHASANALRACYKAKDGSPVFNSGYASRLVKPYMAVKLFFIVPQKCVNVRAVQQRVE